METPEGFLLPPLARTKSIGEKFQLGAQHQHLDFKSTTAKLLKKQGDVEMSPGHLREKASMTRAKKQQDAEKETERQMDGKATFTQCVFNLANILMVRLLLHALGLVVYFHLDLTNPHGFILNCRVLDCSAFHLRVPVQVWAEVSLPY
jgi:hypothetical protein